MTVDGINTDSGNEWGMKLGRVSRWLKAIGDTESGGTWWGEWGRKKDGDKLNQLNAERWRVVLDWLASQKEEYFSGMSHKGVWRPLLKRPWRQWLAGVCKRFLKVSIEVFGHVTASPSGLERRWEGQLSVKSIKTLYSLWYQPRVVRWTCLDFRSFGRIQRVFEELFDVWG